MKHTEVERKFSLADPDRMRSRLTRLHASLSGQSRQTDVYYNHPARDFLAHEVVSEWLRLRTDQEDDRPPVSSINFKQWLPIGSPEATHAAEYESSIADREALTRLLEALGFTAIVTVDKSRQRWLLPTPSGPVEIAIDNVARLGVFAEFEYAGSGDLPEADTAISWAVEHAGTGLGERDRRGYPYLLLDGQR
jgi:adenylate cyclase, class 2